MNMFIYESQIQIRAPRERVWPLLTGAVMVLPPPLLLRLGLPRPMACQLSPDGQGRECQTSRGRIRQRILDRRAPEYLAFERTSDRVGLGLWLRSMKDAFTLECTDDGMRLTRWTQIEPRIFADPLLRMVLPVIHRYVNRNFKFLAEAEPGETPAP